MFERWSERVRELARSMTVEQLRQIEAMFDEQPGISAVLDGDRVVIEGRRLARRRIENSRLRGAWR